MSDPKGFDTMPLLTHQALGFEKPKKIEEDEDDEIPRPINPEPTVVDPFIDEINKIKNSQSPAVRSAIESAPCFGRNWYIEPTDDPEDTGICTEIECDLRALCSLVYSRASGKEITPPEKGPASPQEDQEIPSLTAKKKRKARGSKPFLRRPYVDCGTPADKMASRIWELLGGPPSLPDTWSYPGMLRPEDKGKDLAPSLFVDKFGKGIMVSRRHAYHVYFFHGYHFLRIWVNNPNLIWLDLGKHLTKKIVQYAPGVDLQATTQSKSKFNENRYRFYPYRVRLTAKVFEKLADIFKHFKIRPTKHWKETDDGHSD
jgi:hypothetical protein